MAAATPDQPDRLEGDLVDEPQLFVVLECDRPLAGGARYSLAHVDEVTIGRGVERLARYVVGDHDRMTLDLRLPGPLLSTSHLKLSRTPHGWQLDDLGSRNGTFLNLKQTRRDALHDGDLIEIGRVILRFRILPTAAPAMRDADPNQPPATGPLGFTTLLPPLATQLHELSRIAASSLPILLLGETGTGKEVIARGIHELSGRPGPLVAVNCGALSGTLLDSQLFGHVRGSFTGALRDELGFVRASDGGTLFLDEIGDLPLPAQAALLRVLQEREVVPVGSTAPVKVDLRMIAATHRQLDLLAARGEFRADLYARLSGHIHQLTPLRERREDFGLLVGELLAREVPEGTTLRFGADAGRALVTSDWPLNIRQLEQALARAVTLAEDGLILARHLVVGTPRAAIDTAQEADARPRDAEDTDREAQLRELLEHHHGNITEVARAMGCSRMQIHRWMQRYAIEADAFRRRS